MASGIGIGDPDFCGDEDEYRAAYLNFTDKPVVVERSERIAQGTLVQFTRAEWEEVGKLNRKTSGGFGST
ncbi:MAG: dUTP diphosphatase, partial [bacterium]